MTTTLPTYTYDLFTHDDREIAGGLTRPFLSEVAVERAIRQAIVDLKGTALLGIDTEVYWCGVLYQWPWADLPDGAPDEQAVIDAVLERATVSGANLTLTLAGSEWEPALVRLAETDAAENEPGLPSDRTRQLYADAGVTWQPVDLTFGLNQEAEMHVIARHVFQRAVEIITSKHPQEIA